MQIRNNIDEIDREAQELLNGAFARRGVYGWIDHPATKLLLLELESTARTFLDRAIISREDSERVECLATVAHSEIIYNYVKYMLPERAKETEEE